MAAKYCEPCNARGRTPTAFRWCTECEETLCSECTEAHKVQKMSRNHHLVEICKIPKRVNLSYSCSKHQHLPFDYFCVDHDVICCKECLPKNHLACKNVTSIDIASKNSKRSQSFLDSEEQLRFILEALEKLIINRKENCSRIEQEEKIILNQLASIKQNVISRLESLEGSLLKQLTEMKGKYATGIQRQEKEIVDLVTSSKSEKEGLEFVRDHGSEKQAFVSIHLSKPILDEIENKVKQLAESFVDASFRFVGSTVKEKIADLGSIQIKETPFSFPFTPYKQRQSQAPVVPKRQNGPFTHLYDIDMEGKELGGVTGITISVANTLIFCDVNTKNVYFCMANDAYQSFMRSPYSPWDIQIIPETTTAVMSSRYKPYILFIDMGERIFSKTIEVKQSESGGIAATRDNIFVGTVGKIKVLDKSGNFKKEIRLQHRHSGIRYISVCLNGNVCYSIGHDVHCITPDGDPVFTYASADFRNARNITIDNFGNIYVLGGESHNIHKLTTTGNLVDILFIDNLSDPLAFCFSNDWSKVYIADKDGEIMSVFKTNM